MEVPLMLKIYNKDEPLVLLKYLLWVVITVPLHSPNDRQMPAFRAVQEADIL